MSCRKGTGALVSAVGWFARQSFNGRTDSQRIVLIDDGQIVRGGDWSGHAVCDVPMALIHTLCSSADKWTAKLAQNELSIREQDPHLTVSDKALLAGFMASLRGGKL